MPLCLFNIFLCARGKKLFSKQYSKSSIYDMIFTCTEVYTNKQINKSKSKHVFKGKKNILKHWLYNVLCNNSAILTYWAINNSIIFRYLSLIMSEQTQLFNFRLMCVFLQYFGIKFLSDIYNIKYFFGGKSHLKVTFRPTCLFACLFMYLFI